jgi:hypothetical protein
MMGLVFEAGRQEIDTRVFEPMRGCVRPVTRACRAFGIGGDGGFGRWHSGIMMKNFGDCQS